MKRNLRIGLALVIALALCLGLLVVGAGADDEVAQIGEAKYATLAEAIAEVPADGTETTITMIADETIAGNAGITIPVGKNIVLDLNGFTVKNAVNENKASQVFSNNGSLTIMDSSDTNADGTGTGLLTNAIEEGTQPGEWWSTPQYNYATNVIKNSGTLTVKSGKILQTAAGSICYAVDNNNTSYDTTLNVEGGLIADASGTAVRMFCNSTVKTNAVNMTGGAITTPGYAALWIQLPGNSGQAKKAVLNVSAGTISADEYSFYDYSYGDVFDAVEYNLTGGYFDGYVYSYGIEKFISGGTFTEEPDAAYIADGYGAVEQDGVYVIRPVAAVTLNDDGGMSADIPNDLFDEYASEAFTVSPAASDDVSVTFDAAAVDQIAANAGSADVALVIDDVTQAGDTGKTFEIKMLKVVGGVLTDDEVFSSANASGTALVTVPYELAPGQAPEVYLVEGETRTAVKVESHTATSVSFKVPHFSIYAVETADAVASFYKNGVLQYSNLLTEAIANADDGSTVTVLKDSAGDGVVVPQGKYTGLTVDFDGHSYDVSGNLVGSTGTENNGFQLLKDNTLTFKNGTITTTKPAPILIQNYSNLTLDNMTLSAVGKYMYQYTLSNNNGNIVIKDSTINAADYSEYNISASDVGSFAFDVCRYSSYPSVNVTVKGNSVINGDVEVYASGSDPKDGFSLTLESGDMNGSIVLDSTAQAAINSNPEDAKVTKNDTFNQDAPNGYIWVDNGNGTQSLGFATGLVSISLVPTGDKTECDTGVVDAEVDGTVTADIILTNESEFNLSISAMELKLVLPDGGVLAFDDTDVTNRTAGSYTFNGTRIDYYSNGASGLITLAPTGTEGAEQRFCSVTFHVADAETLNTAGVTYANNKLDVKIDETANYLLTGQAEEIVPETIINAQVEIVTTYDYTFDVDGVTTTGTVGFNLDPVTDFAVGDNADAYADPVKTGFTFAGWTATAGNTTTADAGCEAVNGAVASLPLAASDTTYYAVWTFDGSVVFIDYTYAGSGKKLMLVGTDAPPASGNAMIFGGKAMFTTDTAEYLAALNKAYDNAQGNKDATDYTLAYVYIVDSSETLTTAYGKLAVNAGENKAVDRSGDVNRNSKINSGDFGIVDDLLSGRSSAADVEMRLRANIVPGDNYTTNFASIADIAAIINQIS